MTSYISPEDALRAEEGFVPKPPGTYLAEVVKDFEKVSMKGDPYISAQFVAVDPPYEGKTLCFDIIMLAGDGLGIGLKKLKGLGVDASKGFAYNSGDLRGRRVRLILVEDEYKKPDGTKTKRLKPVFDPDRGFGYVSLESAGASPPLAPAPISEVSDEECECGHGPRLHAKGACEAAGCACKGYASLPF